MKIFLVLLLTTVYWSVGKYCTVKCFYLISYKNCQKTISATHGGLTLISTSLIWTILVMSNRVKCRSAKTGLEVIKFVHVQLS